MVVWLLSVPLDLYLEIDTQAERWTNVRVRWFYGLVRSESGAVARAASAPRSPATKSPSKIRASSTPQARRFFWAMFRSEGFTQRVLHSFLKTWRAIELHDNKLSMKIGLDDPVATAMLSGTLEPFARCMPNTRFEPDFLNPCFIIKANTRLRLVPLRFIVIAVTTLLSRDVVRGIYRGIRAAR